MQKTVESLPKKGSGKKTDSKIRTAVDEESDEDSEAGRSIDDLEAEPEEEVPEKKR